MILQNFNSSRSRRRPLQLKGTLCFRASPSPSYNRDVLQNREKKLNVEEGKNKNERFIYYPVVTTFMTTPYEKQLQTRIQKLGKAKTAFSKLERDCSTSDTAHVPGGYESHFLMVSYAVSVLETLGRERLLELEQKNVVHSSTISGGSLPVAKSCVENYIDGVREFTRDNYEQLYRTCGSASNLFNDD